VVLDDADIAKVVPVLSLMRSANTGRTAPRSRA